MNSKRFALWALALLLGLLLVRADRGEAAETLWQARYWNNTSLAGEPVLNREERDLNYDWKQGSPAPGVNTDNWSARWGRTARFVNSGTYRFTATVDDGIRLWVDDTLILDAWRPHDRATFEVDHALSAGEHRLKVEYYEGTGSAVARLQWRYVPTVPTVFYGWRGEYFGNSTLSGSPLLVRDDAQINFDWERNSPAPGIVPADDFSVRWTRTLPFTPGRYTFSVVADDGVRLWVNNQLLIDRWQPQVASTYSANIMLPAGQIPIKMEYYDLGHHAVAHMNWSGGTGGTGNPVIGNWRGEYYNNETLAGAPVAVRDDATIDFNWGRGAPLAGIGQDSFSVRWTRTLTLPPGRYRFTTTSDDGARLWVNNRLLIDRWTVQATSANSAEMELLGGPVALKMEYFERAGDARAQLSWQLIGTTPTGSGGLGTATVTAGALNVRSGPGTGYSIITAVSRGTLLNLMGYRNADANWIMVATLGGTQGWVHAGYVQSSTTVSSLPVWNGQSGGNPPPAPAPQPGTMAATVTAFHLNMRSGPGITYPVLEVLDRGNQLTLSYRNSAGNWVYGTLADGTRGWIHASYIQTAAGVATLPVWNN